MKGQDNHEPLDLVWGAEGIAKVIGQTTRATYHMLEAGELPARQVGRRWVVSREALQAFFLEQAS
ncbi:helix-turn-helix domain-containing protein [Devosia sp. 2618]|uniref:helix-turn-helix domain-containing protein n=1 Tax=Devosia sp. 2618 TaxID=3156454 RepID=UPI0033942F76